MNVVGRKTAPQGPDDRDSATHARFKGQAYTIMFGCLVYFLAGFRQKRLIGSDHMLAPFHGLQNILLGLLQAAHKLYNHMDVRIINHIHGLGGQQVTIHRDPSVRLNIQIRYLPQGHFVSHTTRDNLPVFDEYFNRPSPNSPKSDNSYINS